MNAHGRRSGLVAHGGRRWLALAAAIAMIGGLITIVGATSTFGAEPDGPSTFPAPSMSAPPCDPATGEGLCVRDEGLSVAVGGEIGGVGDVLNVSGSGLIPCQRLTWQDPKQVPDLCHARLVTQVTGCLVYDLWEEALERGPGWISSNGEANCEVTFSEEAPGPGGPRPSCSGSGNFATFVNGGSWEYPDVYWSQWAPGLEATCTMTVTSVPEALDGPAWLRITREADCNSIYCVSQLESAGEVWVRVDAPVRNRGPKVDCVAEDLGNGTVRFRASEITHPLNLGIEEISWTWANSGEEIGTGTSVEVSSAQEERATVSVTDSDGVTTECDVVVPEPAERLDVTLTRTDSGPVETDEPFQVMLTVRAPAGNPGDVLGVTATELLDLPDFLEHVDGDLASGFDLPPGESRSATLTLKATEPGEGTISSTWTGMREDATTITRTGELHIEATGSIGGEWFRQDLLGEYVQEGKTTSVRLRIDNESGQDLSAVTLVDAVVAAPGTGSGADPDPDPGGGVAFRSAAAAVEDTGDLGGVGGMPATAAPCRGRRGRRHLDSPRRTVARIVGRHRAGVGRLRRLRARGDRRRRHPLVCRGDRDHPGRRGDRHDDRGDLGGQSRGDRRRHRGRSAPRRRLGVGAQHRQRRRR